MTDNETDNDAGRRARRSTNDHPTNWLSVTLIINIKYIRPHEQLISNDYIFLAGLVPIAPVEQLDLSCEPATGDQIYRSSMVQVFEITYICYLGRSSIPPVAKVSNFLVTIYECRRVDSRYLSRDWKATVNANDITITNSQNVCFWQGEKWVFQQQV